MSALMRAAAENDADEEDGTSSGDADHTLKIVILGDGTCGKTSLCTRFAQRDFSGKYNQVSSSIMQRFYTFREV